MNLTVRIKEEIREEVLDDTETPVIEAEVSKQLPQNDSSSVSCSDDDLPGDWFSGASSDSEEAIVDAPVAVTAASVSNDPIKEEQDGESLSIFASTQSASPSIIVKDETCPCGDDCLDCLQTDESDSDETIVDDQSDSDETIVDEQETNVSTAPVSNTRVTPRKRSPPCPECGKTFSSNTNLKIHQKVHTGQRPYVCVQCRKAFKRLAHLTRHQETHQAERSRPFSCTRKRSHPCPECGKTLSSNADLIRHQRSHTGERPYVCDQCPKAFAQLWTLKQHQATHQAVRSRPFHCSAEGCGKDFPTKQELTVHSRSHTGERPYQCPLCPKAFTTSSNVKTHQRTAHPTEP